MSNGHALLPPSGAHRWLYCPGSVAASVDAPESYSTYADEGTAAHALLEWCLREGKSTVDFPHFDIRVGVDGNAQYGETTKDSPKERNRFIVNDEMQSFIQTVVDAVKREAGDGEVIAEQRVDFSEALGVAPGTGTGTADVRVRDYAGKVLQVHDLKYGRSPNGIVYCGTASDPNPQLALYAIGALAEDEVLCDWEAVEIHIHQPRLNHHDKLRLTLEELERFLEQARPAAEEVLQGFQTSIGPEEELKAIPIEKLHARELLRPSSDACKWCPAAGFCPALREAAIETVNVHDDLLDGQLPVVDTLPTPEVLGMVERWCEAVTARVRELIVSGHEVTGWKMVRGKRGARAWSDAAVVEALMRDRFRLKKEEMYDYKLVSPTAAEKVLKESPKRWKQLEDLIVQSEGSETLAPISDKRPAISYADKRAATDDFDDLT